MQTLANLAAQHPDWVIAAAFVTALLESLVVASFLVPGTTVLLAIGAIVAATSLPIEPVWMAASLGAVAGNGVSFWIGRRFSSPLHRLWPLRSDPVLAAEARAFFHDHGIATTLLSRFVAPLRGVVPLAAGLLGMRPLPFFLSSAAAATVSVSGTLLLGAALSCILRLAVESRTIVILAAAFGLSMALLAALIVFSIASTPRPGNAAEKT